MGISVAVIDSGLQGRPDLNHVVTATNKDPASRIVYKKGFHGLDASDGYGHGTHVTGIVAGNGYQSSGPTAMRSFIGIAPSATGNRVAGSRREWQQRRLRRPGKTESSSL